MLVLTCKRGEAVYIGDDIKVTVLGVVDGQVRLGFEAAKKVTILRDELASEETKRTFKELHG